MVQNTELHKDSRNKKKDKQENLKDGDERLQRRENTSELLKGKNQKTEQYTIYNKVNIKQEVKWK